MERGSLVKLCFPAGAKKLLFRVCMCVCLAGCKCVRECMISSGDRILRACFNWRPNANAWLVALHQLLLKSEVACSAGFGPGTKTNFGCLAFFYPQASNARHCCTSRICISCSTIGLYK